MFNKSYLQREWGRTFAVGMLKMDFSFGHLVSISKRTITSVDKIYF